VTQPRRPGLKARVILTYLVIFLVSAAIMAGRAGSLFAQMATTSAEHDLEAHAVVVASAVAHSLSQRGNANGNPVAISSLRAMAGTFTEGASNQLTILDPQGDVMATSFKATPPNQRDRPEVAAALDGIVLYDVRFDPTEKQMMIYAAAPMKHDNQVYAVVQVSLPLAEVTAQIDRFWLSLGATALLAAAAATLAGWWLADQLVRPISRLSEGASRLAAGNLDERVPAHGVAEICRLAEAFNYMAERVQGMINEERAFIANAAHELRTPLTNIMLRAEALGDGALEDPVMARKFAKGIEIEADRLGRMAADLLTLSRHDNMPSLYREPVNLTSLVSQVMDEMALRAEKAGITLAQDLNPGLPRLSADPGSLHTVLVNLVDNALQYTGTGGQVTVSTFADAELRNVVVQVADTGSGIPAEDLPHIFERFYRADKAHSRRTAVAGSGAGLGLAIARDIVEEHGGVISAASGPGEGTTITIRLPALRDVPIETRVSTS
jgi:signal transduction histidine kinase